MKRINNYIKLGILSYIIFIFLNLVLGEQSNVVEFFKGMFCGLAFVFSLFGSYKYSNNQNKIREFKRKIGSRQF